MMGYVTVPIRYETLPLPPYEFRDDTWRVDDGVGSTNEERLAKASRTPLLSLRFCFAGAVVLGLPFATGLAF